MKKIITLCFAVCALSINSYSFCMLKYALQTKERTKSWHTKTPAFRLISFRLGRTNIFNAPKYHHGLLENLYDRNNRAIRELTTCISKLQQQNNLAVAHVFHEDSLDMETLRKLEDELQEILKK